MAERGAQIALPRLPYMQTSFRTPNRYRSNALWAGLSLWIALLGSSSTAQAQALPKELKIIVLQGEGAVNNIQQHTVVEPIVRIEDENQTPIAGASVVFTLPTEGATGEFRNHSKTLMATTDAQGQTLAKLLKVYEVPGKLPIHVTVSYK